MNQCWCFAFGVRHSEVDGAKHHGGVQMSFWQNEQGVQMGMNHALPCL